MQPPLRSDKARSGERLIAGADDCSAGRLVAGRVFGTVLVAGKVAAFSVLERVPDFLELEGGRQRPGKSLRTEQNFAALFAP